MRYRSKKQEALYRERRPLVAKLLEERSMCEACPPFAMLDEKAVYNRRPSVDVHELKNRSQGGSILEERNLLTVCRPCHTRITDNPREAEGLGLHIPGWAHDWMYDEAHNVRLSWTAGTPTKPEWLEGDE